MARNMEIKARVDDLSALEAKVASVADEGPIQIEQDDTFFPCRFGRLKLRRLAPDRGELIYYRRSDKAGPKKSFYIVNETADPEALLQSLTLALGTAGRVSKRRTLYLAGRTRIHLDHVEDLGDFLELEVVLEDDEPAAAGIAEARDLMERLGIDDTHLVEGAYVDLIDQD